MGRDTFVVDHLGVENFGKPYGECLVFENRVGDEAVVVPVALIVGAFMTFVATVQAHGCDMPEWKQVQ